MLRWYGAEGLRAHIRSGVEQAQRFAEWVRADERFEVVAPHPFSLVCFRLRAAVDGGSADTGADTADTANTADTSDTADIDAANAELLARVNATGRVHLTHTRVNGRYTLRLAVGSPQTTPGHLRVAWQLITDNTALLVGR